MSLLNIKDLTVCFHDQQRLLTAVDRLSFSIEEGAFFALIGESGSGKSVTARSIIGLINGSPGIVEGSIRYRDKELLPGLADYCRVERKNGEIVSLRKNPKWQKKLRKHLRPFRGRQIAMIFQDSLGALDPYFTVEEHLHAVFQRWELCQSEKDARELGEYWLRQVALQDPQTVLKSYPHELSGGMAQRVMIALALCSKPELLIADEPTTALDATVQKEIMRLLQELRERFGLTILFITHNIGLVKSFADDIAVLYGGRLVEKATAMELFGQANLFLHPFTQSLLQPFQSIDRRPFPAPLPTAENGAAERTARACGFYQQCPRRMRKCLHQPPLSRLSDSHEVACWLSHEDLSIEQSLLSTFNLKSEQK